MAQAVLSVPKIHCHSCEMTITETLEPVAGVESVRVDIPARQVYLDFDPGQVSLDRVEELLAEEEFPVAEARLV